MEKQVSEGSLHKWFKGSKSKDGKGGWVNVVTGGTCASDEPGEGTPKCVSSAKRASMTKAERLSAARRKKKADPNQQQKSGAAKPTYVSTDKPKKKKMKETYERSLTPLSEKAQKCWKGYEKKGTKKMFGKTYNNCVKKEEVEMEAANPAQQAAIALAKKKKKEDDMVAKKKKEKMYAGYEPQGETIEEADKKGKGSGTKDACYHKVKSRYSVWPSAYASGALVKCRKVGAANWGNSSKKEAFSDWKSEFIWEDGDSSKKPDVNEGALNTVLKVIKKADPYHNFNKHAYKIGASAIRRSEMVPSKTIKKLVKKLGFKKINPIDDLKTPFDKGYAPGIEKVDRKVMIRNLPKDKISKKGYSGPYKDQSTTATDAQIKRGRREFRKKYKDGYSQMDPSVTNTYIDHYDWKDSMSEENDELTKLRNALKTKTMDGKPLNDKQLEGIKAAITQGGNKLEEDWQKTNRQDKTDGMSQKAVNAYKRENPGSKLKTAVTKKPSSLKRGSKDAKRRKSFCSRMKGMKKRLTSAKTARDPDSRINKALRRWNC